MSDNASSIVKTFQVNLPEFILHKTGNEVTGEDKEQLLLEPVPEQDFVEDGRFKYSSCIPQRVSCFTHTKQFCIKDCLQDPEFLLHFIGK